MLTFREELSSDAETIVRRIDAQLSKIEADLRSVPTPEICNVQEQTALAHHVFKSVGIRGLVMADTASSDPKYCSNFGTQERLIDEAFWQAKQVEDVIFARLQVTEHRRDLSFALAVYRDDKIVIGTINPRVVLGWWIEPYDNDARVTMSFPDSDMPLLDRNQSEFAGKELSTSLMSSRYPIEIKVTKTMGLLTNRIETFFVRLSILGLLVFGLVFVIDVYTRLNSEEESYERL
ncbi:hypothetical protein [Vibrio mediterranei]|uniref:hypothetical protein n=1 Tax=Vibrio mediterranei TaxID=689 RepID=UPI004067774C